jgi:tRNA pseudouridine-54 N-methylase
VLPPVRVAVAGVGEIRKRHERIDMSAYETLKARYIKGDAVNDLEFTLLMCGRAVSPKTIEAAAAELERLQAIEAAAPQAVKALWLAINSDKDSQRRGVYKAAIAALAPQPGDGDEKG